MPDRTRHLIQREREKKQTIHRQKSKGKLENLRSIKNRSSHSGKEKCAEENFDQTNIYWSNKCMIYPCERHRLSFMIVQ